MSGLNLPVDDYTERYVIGAALLGGTESMASLRTALEADDFFSQRHRDIWATCCGAFDAGEEVTAANVYSRLREARKEESTGGLSYLCEITEGVPLCSLDPQIQRLKDHTSRRRMIRLCDNIEKRCLAGDPEPEIREALQRGVAGLSATDVETAPISTRELVDKIGIEELLQPSKQNNGLRVPWHRLNQAIGGLRAGQMIVVAAYTSRGKSSLACQIATAVTKQGAGVFYWTTEMTPEALFRRMVDQMSGIDGLRHRESCLSHEEIQRARSAVGWLYEHPVWFDRTSRSMPAMLASLRQVKQKHEIGLVVVDHLQHVKGSGRMDSRAREVSDISRSLKMGAIDFDLPFLVVSQVSRPKEDGQALTIHMLKESGDVENDADVILLLNSPKPAGLSPVTVGLNVAKQREGPAGFDIPLMFRPSTQSFESLED